MGMFNVQDTAMANESDNSLFSNNRNLYARWQSYLRLWVCPCSATQGWNKDHNSNQPPISLF